MSKQGCALLIVVLATASVAWGQPAISDHDGTIARGGELTLQGTGFGTKATPSPYKFDDFENGTVGQDLNGWNFSTSDGINPEYSDEYVRPASNRSAVCIYENGQYLSSFGTYRSEGLASVYMDFWVLFADEARLSRNHKLYRLYSGTTQGRPNQYLQLQCDDATPVARFTNDYVDGTYSEVHHHTDWHPTEALNNWVHLQFYLNQSDAGEANGILQAWFDCGDRVDRTDYKTRDTSYTDDWHSLWFGNYMGNEADSHCPAIDNAHVYFDDVYIDITRARVEIGDNADYESCTHREIQIPVSWGSSEITVAANPGSFANGSEAYVFVIDQDGRVSNGHGPIEVRGDVDPQSPGKPTKPWLVN